METASPPVSPSVVAAILMIQKASVTSGTLLSAARPVLSGSFIVRISPGLPRVADRQGLPDVAVRLAPVHDAAAVLGVDLHVHGAVWGASVLDPPRLDARHDPFELGDAHAEAVVLHGERAIGLVEIQRQSLVQIHGTEGTRARLGPGNSQKAGEQLRRGPPVPGRHDHVVELNAHPRTITWCSDSSPFSRQIPAGA